MNVRAVAPLAVLCALAAVPVRGNGEYLYLECPCRVTSSGGALTVSAGVRSFRDHGSGPLRLRIAALADTDEESLGVSTGLTVATLPLDVTVAAGERVSVEASMEIDVPAGTGEVALRLDLEEQAGTSWQRQQMVRMEAPVTLGGGFDVTDLDYLEDSDGDGVADANERLTGTDPADAESVPGPTTIDVLGLHTRGYADLFGGDPVARISHLFASANAMLSDSAVPIRLRVVGAAEVEVPNEHEWRSRVDNRTLLAEGDRHGADLTVLFTIHPPNVPAGYGCEVANRDRGHFNPYRVQHCLANVKGSAGAFVLIHELGHVMGLAHSVSQGGFGTWRWSRGHDVPDDFTTIMSYGRGGTRLNVFSSPVSTCRGRLNSDAPCGVSRDEVHGADAATSLDAVRFQIALTRPALEDADGDGFVDPVDDLPQDSSDWRDTDADGIGNKTDADDDGDGVEDAVDAFPLDATETADADGDGVGDNADAFPDDAGETADADADGVGDNADAFPDDPDETTDTDGDGVGDNGDPFPDDPDEWADTDADGVGDNADPDADDDGVANETDLFPLDAAKSDIASYVFVAEAAGDRLGQTLFATGGDDPRIVIGASRHDSGRGAAYLVAVSDLAALDAADGNADREIGLANTGAGVASWKFVGEAANQEAGVSAASYGDMDGDGLVDIVVGASNFSDPQTNAWSAGAVYFVSGDDIAAADAADGTADRTVSLAHVAAQPRSWKVVGERCANMGASVAAEDLDGDGRVDLIVGAPTRCYSQPGEVYVVSYAALAAADAADGLEDGVVRIGKAVEQPDSYRLTGETPGGRAGAAVGFIGDVDGDGNADFGIGAPSSVVGELAYAGIAYLVSTGGLALADAADGETDGVVELARMAGQSGSWKATGSEWSALGQRIDRAGPGEVLLGGWTTHIVAERDLAEIDAADGVVDGTIATEWIAGASNSWTLPYVRAADFADDVDGDGNDDMLWHSGDAHLFTVATLAELDETDGDADRNVASWVIGRDDRTWRMRRSGPGSFDTLVAADDVDGDGRTDILVVERPRWDSGQRDRAYLLAAADLSVLDRVDGSVDRDLRLGSVAGDSDGDGLGNTLDRDDDNDGFVDAEDRFQLDPTEWADTDGDTYGDNADAFPEDSGEAFDTDGDGVGNNADEDDDGDGIADGEDEYPLDTDNDGVANRDDPDDDDDGVSDDEDDLPIDPAESVDTDADGVGNNADEDDDDDGVLDDEDDLPLDPTESVDSDGDGTGDNADAFPNDPDEQADADGDGTGDNADADDDNDGVADAEDAFPFDATASADTDGDGVPDNRDAFPEDATESVDADGDGVGDNADDDDDNDGVADTSDLFPSNPDRWSLTSLKFVPESDADRLGAGLGTAGDLDADGLPEVLVGAPGHDTNGAVYLVSSRDLASADEADGTRDGTVAVQHIAPQPYSWKLLGKAGQPAGAAVASAGDLDGNGSAEFAVGASGFERGAVYLVSGADLPAADAMDGAADGIVGLEAAPAGSGSWRVLGGVRTAMGTSLAAGWKPDAVSVLFGQPGSGGGTLPGTAHLIAGGELAVLDGTDGDVDGSLELRTHAGPWLFTGEDGQDQAGAALGVADFDGDGLADVVIGAPDHDADGIDDGAVYVVGSRDFKGSNSFDLVDVVGQTFSFKIVGEAAGDRLGSGVAVADVDGDGQADLILGAASGLGSRPVVHVVSGERINLARLDRADGMRDGLIGLGSVGNQRGQWRLTPSGAWRQGVNPPGGVAAADVDGDGRADLLVPLMAFSARTQSVSSDRIFLLLPGDALAQDESVGATVSVESIAAEPGAYAFYAEGDLVAQWWSTGLAAAAAGDVDGDGLEDFLLGVTSDDGSVAYLIVAADLDPLDAADGRRDGSIDLANIVGTRL